MASRRSGAGSRTDESDMPIYLCHGRIRFKPDGLFFSGFGRIIELNNNCCVSPPNVTSNSPVNKQDKTSLAGYSRRVQR